MRSTPIENLATDLPQPEVDAQSSKAHVASDEDFELLASMTTINVAVDISGGRPPSAASATNE